MKAIGMTVLVGEREEDNGSMVLVNSCIYSWGNYGSNNYGNVDSSRGGIKIVKIPFGKFRNINIEEIPTKYLIWLTEQDWFNDNYTQLSNEIVLELEWRNKWDRHIK